LVVGLVGVAAGQGVPKEVPPASLGRPVPPVHDPHAAGYVAAKELPDGVNAPVGEDGNFILGPTHPAAAEMSARAGGLRGRVVEFTMRSEESRVYPGIMRAEGTAVGADPDDPLKPMVTSHAAPYVRRVAVYVPPGYAAGKEMPFIVGADGPDMGLFTALDNLIAEGRLPAMVAVSVGNGGGDMQGSERGLEYDTMSGKYAEFVETEVLPRVEAEAQVKLTRDPEGRATMGASSGGACAMAMAWYHPEWYHRVLVYSGTFVNQQWPWDAKTPGGAWEFARTLIPGSARKPLRIWIEVGDRDMYYPNAMRDGMHDWVEGNEAMAKALAAKGYQYQFVFARNAVHVDRAVKAQTLPEALEWVWRGYGGR